MGCWLTLTSPDACQETPHRVGAECPIAGCGRSSVLLMSHVSVYPVTVLPHGTGLMAPGGCNSWGCHRPIRRPLAPLSGRSPFRRLEFYSCERRAKFRFASSFTEDHRTPADADQHPYMFVSQICVPLFTGCVFFATQVYLVYHGGARHRGGDWGVYRVSIGGMGPGTGRGT